MAQQDTTHPYSGVVTGTITAFARGRFDLGCPNATAVVLSSDFIQLAIQGPWVSGVERLEYTLGIEGWASARPSS